MTTKTNSNINVREYNRVLRLCADLYSTGDPRTHQRRYLIVAQILSAGQACARAAHALEVAAPGSNEALDAEERAVNADRHMTEAVLDVGAVRLPPPLAQQRREFVADPSSKELKAAARNARANMNRAVAHSTRATQMMESGRLSQALRAMKAADRTYMTAAAYVYTLMSGGDAACVELSHALYDTDRVLERAYNVTGPRSER